MQIYLDISFVLMARRSWTPAGLRTVRTTTLNELDRELNAGQATV